MENSKEEQYLPEWTGRVKKLGRVFVYNKIMWLSWSGTGIEWECDGGFSIRLKSDEIQFGQGDSDIHLGRYAIYKDEKLIIEDRLECPEKTLNIDAFGRHVYRFVKLSESADSSIGIVSLEDKDGGCENITPTEAKRLKIEVIGDSITCGYGVEGNLSQTYTTATENVSAAYGYIVARNLNADFSIVSKSGAGLISGFTCDGERNTDNILTGYYDKMGCSMFKIEDELPSNFDYDFSFEPDIIVLLAGTNDSSFCCPADPAVSAKYDGQELENRRREFCNAYKEFLGHLRRKNPFAKIICALGIMTEALNETVEMAVSMQIAEGDRRVYWLPLKEQDPANGYGTDYHPSEKTQMLLAETVTDFVEKVIRKEI